MSLSKLLKKLRDLFVFAFSNTRLDSNPKPLNVAPCTVWNRAVMGIGKIVTHICML